MTVREMFELNGRVALVTGGSRGLGLQIATALGEMGAKIAISARKAEELAEARQTLEAKGIETFTEVNDLSDPRQAQPLCDAVASHYGTIDILVNNAGTTWGARAEEHPLPAWSKVMTLNTTSVFALSQAVANRCFIPRRSGNIIVISSTAALRVGGLKAVAYSASKAGALHLARALAIEWGQYNIRVNAICPGFFPSKMTSGLLKDIEKQVIERTPLGRMGDDTDLMGAAVFLASNASRHVTGQYIAVDGGSTSI
ncbi:MAG TPA: SDR family oxidoreductase [Steroidobacteraceae bacterium]|jgi:NAD(P)-dependent dehydrogenase (short-subunit alcohol dehydrogenase family)|nr:SDR family oxidoreductase [Steroidobacteraceae bacterium]